MKFLHRNGRKYTMISHDGKTQKQNDKIFIDRRWDSTRLDVRMFRRADYDTDNDLVVTKFGKKWQEVNKQH